MKKREIKAIIFDVGGVIMFYDHMIAAKQMSKLIKVSSQKIFRIISNSGKYARFTQFCEKGALSKDYWNLLAKKLEIKKIPYHKFNRLWNNIFCPNKKMKKIIFNLKEDYKLALISNMGKEHKDYLIKKYKITGPFQISIFSCDIGIRKPDLRIYKLALKKLGLKPAEVVFIDDIKENIKGVNKIGIRGVLFKNNNQLFKDLKKLGVKIR